MVIRFIARNFLSVSEEIEFSMFPYQKLKRHQEHLYNYEEVQLLKIAAMYGANGSGKSNIVKAVHFLNDLVVGGTIKHPKFKHFNFKLEERFSTAPTKFEIEFRFEKSIFVYEIEFDRHEIKRESLHLQDLPGETESLIFLREATSDGISIEVSPDYKVSEKDKLLIEVYQDEILEGDVPFLYLVRGKDRYPEIQAAFSWFRWNLFVLYPDSKYSNITADIKFQSGFHEFLVELLPKFDTGISEIATISIPLEQYFGEDDKQWVEKVKEKFAEEEEGTMSAISLESRAEQMVVTKEDGEYLVHKLYTKHETAAQSSPDFDLEEESDGTRRLLDLIPALDMLIKEEVVFFVDEIGRSLHPTLLKEFIRFYLSVETKGQLIFTTHESYLLDLDLFRQDEIWFVEKDNKGGTRTYSMSDFRPRADLDVRKGYLNGRFGAIPFLGSLESFATEHEQKAQ